LVAETGVSLAGSDEVEDEAGEELGEVDGFAAGRNRTA
jgi:hypothetical protein